MKLSIKNFILGILLLLMIGMYAVFANYFFIQREVTATIISQSVKNDLSELSYVLSKHIRKEAINTSRALLDRKSANNNYVNAIAIFDDDKLILTTDTKFSTPPQSKEVFSDEFNNIYQHLHSSKAFEGEINYYVGKNIRHYSLVFFIDHHSIDENFAQARDKFILLFVFIPIILILFIWLVMRKLVTSPLELLRQYSYYQSEVPKPFKIKELEYIRASMVQTFLRLDQERTDLYNLSRTDSLSGLANRNLLQERVEQLIEHSKRTNSEFALLFLDLDHFKSVNDSLGHDVGDELLKNVAHTIQDILRTNDVVARIGGDEFVIVLTDYLDEMELVEIVSRIQEQLTKPWIIKSFPIQITSSIGITLYPKDGKTLLSLMKNADIAMYEAKANGRKGYHFFTEELNRKTQDFIELTNTMKSALENGQYELYYQPQNDVQSDKIIGAEALIRWHNPDGKMISPYIFIPIAEHNGFIVELGKWILETAIKQKKDWEEKGVDIKLAINVASKQIQEKGFVEHLSSLLKKYQVNNNNIFLEITEYVFLHDSETTYNTFTAIKELGVQISLDDFGTGYSSLSYLKKFPIDLLKIDKSFLDDYDSKDGSVFVETMITMAHTLNLTVVAEGVEEKEQVDYLKSLDCDFFQGYFCSQPVPIDDFNKLYLEQNCH